MKTSSKTKEPPLNHQAPLRYPHLRSPGRVGHLGSLCCTFPPEASGRTRTAARPRPAVVSVAVIAGNVGAGSGTRAHGTGRNMRNRRTWKGQAGMRRRWRWQETVLRTPSHIIHRSHGKGGWIGHKNDHLIHLAGLRHGTWHLAQIHLSGHSGRHGKRILRSRQCRCFKAFELRLLAWNNRKRTAKCLDMLRNVLDFHRFPTS